MDKITRNITMPSSLVVLELELVQAVVGGWTVTVVVGVARVEIRLLLDSLPVSLLAVNVRFVFVEAGEVCVAPEWDVWLVVWGCCWSGVRVRLPPVVGLVVVVTDAGVSPCLAEDRHLWWAVQTVMWRMVDRRAGSVRPQAGWGLLGGVILRLGPGEVQGTVVLAVPHRAEVSWVVLGRGRGLEIVVWSSVEIAGVERAGERPRHTRVTKVVVAGGEISSRIVGCERLWLCWSPEHVWIVGQTRGVSTIGQAVLQSGLDHVVMIQPAVGLHHHRLLLANITHLHWDHHQTMFYLRIWLVQIITGTWESSVLSLICITVWTQLEIRKYFKLDQ